MGIKEHFLKRRAIKKAGLIARRECLLRLLQMDGEKPLSWADELVKTEEEIAKLQYILDHENLPPRL